MVIDTIKENLCVNKLVADKKEIIFIEGDMIVPDSKPDILNTICTSGIVCLYRKEILDEKIRVDGGINTYIMYLSEDQEDKIRGLNTTLDFSENINIPNVQSGMSGTISASIKSIECKVINGRKIGIKATIELNIQIYDKNEIEIVNDIQNANDIQILKEDLKVNSLVGYGETKINAKDTIKIDNIDNLAEILKVKICIGDRDVKISYNKILTKAEAKVNIMYLTEDNRINTVTSKIPIVGFIDIPNVTEENVCDINYELKNTIIKPNQTEEHSIYIEMEVGINANVYEEKQINLIQDLYNPSEIIKFDKKNIITMTDKRQDVEIKQIREKVVLEGMEGKKILDVDVTPVINEENKTDSKINYIGDIELAFILEDDNSNLDIKLAKIPFEYLLENIENPENQNINLDVSVESQDFIIQDEGIITSNLDIILSSNSYRNTNLNVIDSIELDGEREEQDYSLIIYIVKKGDTLWNIAKRYGSTVEDIVRSNGIEDENKIYPGQKLFIPRFVRIGNNYD